MNSGAIETILVIGLALFLGQLIYTKFWGKTPETEVKEELKAKPLTVQEFLDRYK